MAQGDPGVGQYGSAGGYASPEELARAGGMGATLNGGGIGALSNVYMGKQYENIGSLSGGLSGRGPLRPDLLAKQSAVWSLDQAKRQFLQGDQRVVSAAMEAYSAYRGFQSDDYAAGGGFWEKAVDQAAYETQLTGKPVTPFEVMERFAKVGAGGSGGGGGGGGTAVVVNLTNPSDAQLLIDQALNGVLGRDATPKERETFLATLNAAERRNPTVATQSSRSGGLNPQQAALEFAEAEPDAAEYTANTQYTDWLMEKISADPTAGVASGL